MAWYLQDSGSSYWLLTVTAVFGQLDPVPSGVQPIVPLILKDSSGGYWQLTITTLGQLDTISVGATSTFPILIPDSNGVMWQVVVSPLGQADTVLFPGQIVADVGPDFQWLGGDEY